MRKAFTFIACFIILIISGVFAFAFIANGTKNPSYSQTPEYGISKSDYNLIRYSYFDSVESYLKKSANDYEILYLGTEDCPWCREFTPIVNNEAKALGKPIIYFNMNDVDREVYHHNNGMAYTRGEYNEIISWIENTSNYDAIETYEREFIGTKTYKFKNEDGKEVETVLSRIYFPRYYLIVKGKIVDCFMPNYVVKTTEHPKTPITDKTTQEEANKMKEYVQIAFRTWISNAKTSYLEGEN